MFRKLNPCLWKTTPLTTLMRTSDSLFEVKRQPTAIDTDFRFGLAVLMASGMAALGHEVLWTRRMIDLLGASTETSARVFECFFFGLCSGAAIVSLKLARIRRHWRFLGWVELGVAIFKIGRASRRERV